MFKDIYEETVANTGIPDSGVAIFFAAFPGFPSSWASREDLGDRRRCIFSWKLIKNSREAEWMGSSVYWLSFFGVCVSVCLWSPARDEWESDCISEWVCPLLSLFDCLKLFRIKFCPNWVVLTKSNIFLLWKDFYDFSFHFWGIVWSSEVRNIILAGPVYLCVCVCVLESICVQGRIPSLPRSHHKLSPIAHGKSDEWRLCTRGISIEMAVTYTLLP